MINIIIGNIIMFISSVLMMIAGLPKSKKTCIILQTIQIFGMSIGNLFLGSLPGFFVNCFSGIRNIFAYKDKLKLPIKLLVIFLSIAISLTFNNIGFFVIFPILSIITFTFVVDTKNVVLFKWIIILGNIFWLIHDVYAMSYVAAVFDILGTITNLIGIIRIKKRKREVV